MTASSTEFLELQAALVGEYSLQREVGRGGMGIVYLARDVQLDRDVAIKVLPSHLARDAVSRERFVREARIAAGLSHPHVVPIHRVGEAGRFVFFVMTFVDGETLGERLRTRGPLPAAEAARVSALAPFASRDSTALAHRRAAAATHLATSVAALESLRMDLLRLHADANNLAPLTTLIEAAQRASDDVRRLADARREVDRLGL